MRSVIEDNKHSDTMTNGIPTDEISQSKGEAGFTNKAYYGHIIQALYS